MNDPTTIGQDGILRAASLGRVYRDGGRRVEALREVDLHVGAGASIGIVGPSGCGKSTLLHLLGLVDRPTTGEVWIDGRAAARLSDRERTRIRLLRLGFVFQRFYLLPVLSAFENVELPMIEAGIEKRRRRARTAELLEFVGLADRAAHRPSELSGGEMQRVAIARALANDPAVLLADEPTGELDRKTGRAIVRLFRRLADGGTSLLVVTHDPQLAESADRILEMEDGRIVRERSAP
ncbi:MAG: ATP-binding cassette domain-containing protein [Candidatus Eisenbacteria bacterium]|nr:ATP-binding cassette domain-containing protein [Candidatus Latescibacterota bacterium]MBD3301048.1 ATP-binding cassette domain-containing protein [Candidatus Eisenbacteria bacterium]